MRNSVYVLRDTVADESGPLFESRNDGTALRKFAHELKDNPYVHEFELWCVGVMDHDKDVLIAIDKRLVEVTLQEEDGESNIQ